jgi:hypothetical protein
MRGRPFRRAVPSAARYIPRPSFPLVVDTMLGTAAGTGSASRPLNSLAAAITACAGLPDWEIRVRATEAAPLRQEVVYESSVDLTIAGYDEEPFHVKASDAGTGWAGTGPVYFKALGATTIGAVIVETMTETIGPESFFLVLTPTAGTQTAPGPGEYGFAAGTVYVRLPDDSSPALHKIEVGRRNTGIATRGLGRLTVKHAHVTGAITANILNGLTGQLPGSGLLTVEDSFLGYSSRTGQGLGATGQWAETMATRVKTRRIGNDGFNFHATAGLRPRAVLNDCDGSYSGHVAGDSAQGASNHEQTIMVLNGGRFDRNVSGGMVVIDEAVCDIHGDTIYGPVSMDRNMRLGNTAGTIADQAGCAWLNRSIGTVTGSVSVTNGFGRGVKVTRVGGVTGAQAISSTGNAMPDSIAS